MHAIASGPGRDVYERTVEMKVQSKLRTGSLITSHGGRRLLRGLVTLAAVSPLLLAGTSYSGPPKKGSVKSDAFDLEKIPGSNVERLILTPKAAERLGIEMGNVTEQQILRNQVVGGRIVPPQPIPAKKPPTGGFSGFGKVTTPTERLAKAAAGDSSERWVEVTLSKGELERLRKDAPARVLLLPTRQRSGEEVSARLVNREPIEDLKRSMVKLYYKVAGKGSDLKLYERVRVELGLSGDSAKKRAVVPYGAIYYDAKGDPWVYVSPKPLVYERRRVNVERVVGNMAVLADGPPVGTSVVTVGVPMLWGAEVVFGY